MKVVFSAAARDDLMDIAVYIAPDNPARALSFVDELEAKCQRLRYSPDIGTARPELGDGIRMLPHGHYLIFYRKQAPDIRIERIMHAARDIRGEEIDPAASDGDE